MSKLGDAVEIDDVGEFKIGPIIYGAVPAALLAMVFTWWLFFKTPSGPTIEEGDAIVVSEDLETEFTDQERTAGAVVALGKANLAMSEGRLFEPVDDNAILYYEMTLEYEPDNDEALVGLERVADLLLVNADVALKEDRLGDALDAFWAVEDFKPDAPMLDEFRTQLAAYGQVLVTRSEEAMNAGDLPLAEEYLTNAARILTGDELTLVHGEIENVRLASLAAVRMDEGQLMEPADDSARDYLLALRDAAPEHPALQAGLERLSDLMLAEAKGAIGSKDFKTAGTWVKEAETLGVSTSAVSRVSRDLSRAEARVAAAAKPKPKPKPKPVVTEEAPKVAARTQPAQATPNPAASTPTPSPAAATQPEESKPAAADTAQADSVMLARVEPETSAAMTDGGTPANVGAGAVLPETQTEPAAGSPEPDAEPQEEDAGTGLVPLSTFEFRRYVNPKYPRIAKQYGREGWVELEFTVNQYGETEEIEVLGAAPNNMFNRSAISAVKRWTFEAPSSPGRTRVRLNFTQ